MDCIERRKLAAVVILLVGAAGCGAGLHPVRGKVTLPDGTPLAGGQVVFQREGEGETISARGDIEADGSYSLSTQTPGDGAPMGKYKVIVNPPPAVDAEAPAKRAPAAKYSDFSTSGLEFEVNPGMNEFPIQVTK